MYLQIKLKMVYYDSLNSQNKGELWVLQLSGWVCQVLAKPLI